MGWFGNKGTLPLEEFLFDPTVFTIVDVRGGPLFDPAIPTSHSAYLIDIDENPKAFEQKFASQLEKYPMVLYCSKGDSSKYLLSKFSKKYHIRSLDGGMVNYLTTISRLLHQHPYEDPSKKGDTMVKILNALTDRKTDSENFAKIVKRLITCTTDSKFHKLIR